VTVLDQLARQRAADGAGTGTGPGSAGAADPAADVTGGGVAPSGLGGVLSNPGAALAAGTLATTGTNIMAGLFAALALLLAGAVALLLRRKEQRH